MIELNSDELMEQVETEILQRILEAAQAKDWTLAQHWAEVHRLLTA